MVINENGLRENVAMVLSDGFGKVFWAKRSGQEAWQFPQGGVDAGETYEEALYRELREEIGLGSKDVSILQVSKHHFKYKIPSAFFTALIIFFTFGKDAVVQRMHRTHPSHL